MLNVASVSFCVLVLKPFLFFDIGRSGEGKASVLTEGVCERTKTCVTIRTSRWMDSLAE